MTIVSDIVTKLTSDANFAQVLRPDAAGDNTINSSVVVGDLITSTLSGRVYNLRAPQAAIFPYALLHFVRADNDLIDGLPILSIDTIVLELRAATYTTLKSTADTIKSLLRSYSVANSAGAIVISDESEDVENVGDDEQYLMFLELTVTHLATASQALPAAYIYPVNVVGKDPDNFNLARTTVENEIAVTIIEKSTADSIETARGYASELINYQVGSLPIFYSGGELLRQDGHLTTWRERYRVQSRLRT